MKYKILNFNRKYLNVIGAVVLGIGVPVNPWTYSNWWVAGIGVVLLVVSYLSMEYQFKLRRRGEIDFNFKPYTS